MAFTPTERFDSKTHDAGAFDCGHPQMTCRLRRFAGQNQQRGVARTYVTLDDDDAIAGYYSLAAASVEHDQATAAVKHRLPNLPVPAALLARLAVATKHQRIGLGRSLLADALERIEQAADLLAVRAVLVDAIDEQAATFYTALPRTRPATPIDLPGEPLKAAEGYVRASRTPVFGSPDGLLRLS